MQNSQNYGQIKMQRPSASRKSKNPGCKLVVSFVSKLHKPLNPVASVNYRLSKLLFKYEEILNTFVTPYILCGKQ